MMGAMSFLTQNPRARWAAPIAVVVVGAGVIATQGSADASTGLQPRTAEELLVALQKAQPQPMSGEVSQTFDLGLPDVGSLGTKSASALNPTTLLSGSHSWRVWYGGQDQQRVALVDGTNESAVIRNGQDVWTWSSADQSATHTKVQPKSGTATQHPQSTPSDMPDLSTPESAAQAVLSRLDGTTEVTTTSADKVAGRSVYGLVLTPKATDTLVGQVKIAIDPETSLPLAVTVTPKGATNPAIDVHFTSVDMSAPAASTFTFTPPAGADVTEKTAPDQTQKDGANGQSGQAKQGMTDEQKQQAQAAAKPTVTGTGWSAVATGKLPQQGAQTGQNAPSSMKMSSDGSDAAAQLSAIEGMLPKASGAWGSGRVLASRLVTVVITDDGRYAVGAVAPETAYAALAATK